MKGRSAARFAVEEQGGKRRRGASLMGVCRCSGPMERRLRADGVSVARV